MLQEKIELIKNDFSIEISKIENDKQLEEFRLKYFSKNGLVPSLFALLKDAPPKEKPQLGKVLNTFRMDLQNKFDNVREQITKIVGSKSIDIDLTLPGVERSIGSKHILTQTLDEIKSIFKGMGFSVFEGPELESDYNNFEALNFPPDHPARDMQDTFFISDDFVLRTHTSPVQIRLMKSQEPPVRAIMPGRVYRNEAVSSRSYCMFHQVEGLYVDTDVTFAELKGTLASFAKQFYGDNLKFRFRPSYFPFTEPSAEMDITCFICKGDGCKICKHTGWLEILEIGRAHV